MKLLSFYSSTAKNLVKSRKRTSSDCNSKWALLIYLSMNILAAYQSIINLNFWSLMCMYIRWKKSVYYVDCKHKFGMYRLFRCTNWNMHFYPIHTVIILYSIVTMQGQKCNYTHTYNTYRKTCTQVPLHHILVLSSTVPHNISLQFPILWLTAQIQSFHSPFWQK